MTRFSGQAKLRVITPGPLAALEAKHTSETLLPSPGRLGCMNGVVPLRFPRKLLKFLGTLGFIEIISPTEGELGSELTTRRATILLFV